MQGKTWAYQEDITTLFFWARQLAAGDNEGLKWIQGSVIITAILRGRHREQEKEGIIVLQLEKGNTCFLSWAQIFTLHCGQLTHAQTAAHMDPERPRRGSKARPKTPPLVLRWVDTPSPLPRHPPISHTYTNTHMLSPSKTRTPYFLIWLADRFALLAR